MPRNDIVRRPSIASVLDAVRRDVRYALRGFRRTPVFTAVALITLTLAIAANAAMFSLLNALVFRKVPVPDPDSLLQIAVQTVIAPEDSLSYPVVEALQREPGLFAGVAGSTGLRLANVEARGGLARATLQGVTGNYYDVLRVGPSSGRLLGAGDAAIGAAPVAVVGYGFWQRTLGADPHVLGRSIAIEGLQFIIVGIAPKGFTGTGVLTEPDVTLALPAWMDAVQRPREALRQLQALLINVTARLAPGVTVAQADARLRSRWRDIVTGAAAGAIVEDLKGFLAMPLVVRSGATGPTSWLRTQYESPVYAVLAIALLILLIAVVNLASLMLLRAAAREQEIAVRLALGAGRWRLVRQLLTESVLLAAAAVAGGLALASAASRAMSATILDTAAVPANAFHAATDVRVAAFASVLALVAAGVFSLAPLWRIARQDTARTPLRHARTVARTGRLGGLLVGAQVALSLVLVAHAGLLVRSLHHLRSVDAGVRVEDVMVSSATAQPAGYKGVDNDVYYPALMERIRALPGVTAAGISQLVPLSRSWTFRIAAVGGEDKVPALLNGISPGLLDALGIPLRAGRDFAWTDTSKAPRVAIVSQQLASRLFGARDPIRQRIQLEGDTGGAFEVVGVVSDARAANLKDPNPHALYMASMQVPGGTANFKEIVTRGAVSAAALNRAVEPLGREVVLQSRSLAEVIDRALVRERIMAGLAGFFGGLALVLSAIGLYGVTAYAVAQRTREIGIRVALGAESGRVVRDVLRRAFTIVLVGLAVGLPIAWATMAWLRSLLHGIEPRDPFVLAATPLALLAVAALASALPARRAARVDPTVALRTE